MQDSVLEKIPLNPPLRKGEVNGYTGLILAGGRGRRMGGQDKGLVMYQQRPLIEHVLEVMKSQVNTLFISANRNQDSYADYGYPVISDANPNAFDGPLAGILEALQQMQSEYLLVVPCDAPNPPRDLLTRLSSHQTPLSAAHDGERLQVLFSLWHKDLAAPLEVYLAQGERRVNDWFEKMHGVPSDFSDCRECFLNINRL